MTDREIVARVRGAIRDWDFRSDERGMIVTDLRALCDAVERLERETCPSCRQPHDMCSFCTPPHPEIARLTAENERLREALEVTRADNQRARDKGAVFAKELLAHYKAGTDAAMRPTGEIRK